MPTPPSLTPRIFWKPEEPKGPPQRLPYLAALLSLTITAAPLTVHASLRGIYSSSTASARDPALDQVFDASANNAAGVPKIQVSILGIWLNKRITAAPLVVEVRFAPPAGSTSPGPGLLQNVLVTASPLQILIDLNTALSIRATRDVYPPPAPASLLRGPVLTTVTTRANWVKWANIGALDFTILKDNIAGERPLDWKGKVYVLKMLGKKVVAYGENGISVLTPSGTAFGMQTVRHIGIRGKQAVAGNEEGEKPATTHYILDKQAQLWEFGQGLTFLDYSEYLSELGASPVLSYDPQEQRLYLCDGTKGFVYDPRTKSLGRGSATITGIGVQDGTRYVTAPATITLPLFELQTDIYDFGSRRAKTIQSVEVGLDTAATMQVKIEYRQKITSAFASTNFYTIDSRAVKPINCYGYEFRFHLKALATGWAHLDYLRVTGRVHDH